MRRSLGIAALLFALLVASGLHGFSLPVWHRLLDASPEDEVLLGEARRLRGDDWFVSIPLALAQRAHDPPFPRVNETIGFGQDVIVPVPTPVLHPITLLRPAIWGWFLGERSGLAWQWWSQAFGIAIAWACAAWLVAGRRLAIAWGCGALVLLAPVVQLTSLGAAPVLAATGLGLAGALGVREAETRAGVAGYAALLAFSLAALVVAFYPPYQISIGAIALAVVCAAWLAPRDGRRAPRARWLVGCASFALGVAIAAAIAWSIRDAIASMAATEYPGARLADAGRLPLWAPFSNHLAAHARIGGDSDALAFAGSLLLFPVVALGEALRALRRRGGADPVACALLAVLGVLLLHACVSLPEWLQAATGLARVPPGRVRVALAAADALLLARVLAAPRAFAATRVEAGAGAAFAAAALGWSALALHAHHPGLGAAASAGFVAANGVLAYLVLRRWRPPLLLASIAAASAALSLWWNPLVYGGTTALRGSPISRQIVALDRETEGGSQWVAYGPPALGNLFRALGVRALNGVHPLPQPALWRVLDPREARREIWNRYAHVLFELAEHEAPRFEHAGPDGFRIHIAPSSRALACLGVTHVLVGSGAASPPPERIAQPGLVWLRSLHGHHFFRLDRGMTRASCEALGLRLPEDRSPPAPLGP